MPRQLCLAIIALLAGFLPTIAAADESISRIPASVCVTDLPSAPGVSVVNPEKLVQWLLKQRHISDAALDINGDVTTTYEEKVTALSTFNFCKTPKGKDKCLEGDEARQTAIFARLGTLTDFRNQAARADRGDDRFRVWRINSPGQESNPPIAELLTRGSKVLMACNVPPEAGKPHVPTQDAASKAVNDFLSRFRVAGTLDDLAQNHRSQKDLKGISTASLGATGDLQEHSQTITTNAFVAFELVGPMKWSESGNSFYSLLPFVSYRHVRTQDNGAKEHVFGGGLFGETSFAGPLGGTDKLTLSTYYTTDAAQGQKILTGTLDWMPGFLFASPLPFGQYAALGNSSDAAILYGLKAKLIATGGNVFDDGGNAELRDTTGFARVGAQIGIGFRGNSETLLERFEWTTTYKYLYGISGLVSNFHHFSSRVGYVLPKFENYVLSAGYEVGRAEDTLQKVEKWDVKFGVRF